MASCTQAIPVNARPLVQIRGGYRASCGDLVLSVETGHEGWTARVHEHGLPLYTAQRSSLANAKSAALEYALFQAAGPACWGKLDSTGRQLHWSAYW